jgi:hypothetical protein
MHAAYRSSAALSALSVADSGARGTLVGGVGTIVVFAVAVFVLVVALVAVVVDCGVLAGCGVVAAGALATAPSDVEPVEGEEPPHAASATLARATASTAVAVRAVS